MDWIRAAKLVFAFVLLAFGLYGAYLTGEARSEKRMAQAAAANRPEDPPGIKAVKEHHDKTWDGRFGTRCDPCFVPFERLIALPEQFHHKKVGLVGFLVGKPSFGLQLFPNEESARHPWEINYIDIYNDRPADAPVALIPPDVESKLKEGVWVHLVGEFSADTAGPNLGGLTKVHDVDAFPEPQPSYIPPKLSLQKAAPPNIEAPVIDIAPDTH